MDRPTRIAPLTEPCIRERPEEKERDLINDSWGPHDLWSSLDLPVCLCMNVRLCGYLRLLSRGCMRKQPRLSVVPSVLHASSWILTQSGISLQQDLLRLRRRYRLFGCSSAAVDVVVLVVDLVLLYLSSPSMIFAVREEFWIARCTTIPVIVTP